MVRKAEPRYLLHTSAVIYRLHGRTLQRAAIFIVPAGPRPAGIDLSADAPGWEQLRAFLKQPLRPAGRGAGRADR